MQTYIKRHLTEKVIKKLKSNPAVAILGPRQCGKSTLAKAIISTISNALYLDLEKPSDVNKLTDPEAFFMLNKDRLICLDEIQRLPDLFPALRSIIDISGRNGQMLLLGSASRDLIQQGSETLAGRIAYLDLTPFLLPEVDVQNSSDITRKLWLKGGFPRSFLKPDYKESYAWRIDFIRAFLERDIPQLGIQIPAKKIGRFWTMCAHLHGQLLNSSKLGESLGVSHHTVRSYIDLLEQAFVVRTLVPYEVNVKKRLIKSPKIYIRDTGLLHALLGIESHNDLLGHPVYGASWEGFVIENILAVLSDWKAAFYRTSSGNEIDLVLEKGRRRIVVECKASSAPEPTKGFWNALHDLGIKEAYIIAPVKDVYSLKDNVTVSSLNDFLARFSEQ